MRETGALPTDGSSSAARQRAIWRSLAGGYLRLVGVTGLLAAGLSVCLRSGAIVVVWAECALALPLLLAVTTLIWSVTAFPLVLLLAQAFGRSGPANRVDPNGPGVIV